MIALTARSSRMLGALKNPTRRGGSLNRASPLSFLPNAAWTKDEGDQQQQQLHRNSEFQHRLYHTTPQREMVLYATIILVSGLCYVGYKKYHGEPLKPESATRAQEEFQRLEKEREERNMKHMERMTNSKKKHE